MVQHPCQGRRKRATLLYLLTDSMDALYLHDFCFHCLPLSSTLPVYSDSTYISFKISPETWSLNIPIIFILHSHFIIPNWLLCLTDYHWQCLPFPDSCIFYKYITYDTLPHPWINDMVNFANSFTRGISFGRLLKHSSIWPLWHPFFFF